MRKIQFFDTTLRDGEQTPGVNFNTKEKVQLALQLENRYDRSRLSDCIRRRLSSSPSDRWGGDKNDRCRTCPLSEKDIDRAYEALHQAVDPQIHVFLATSEVHRQYKLNMTKAEVLASIKEHVAYARECFEKVQFSPEDATRTDKAFLLEAVQTAIDAGATIINARYSRVYQSYGIWCAFAYLIANIKSEQPIIFLPIVMMTWEWRQPMRWQLSKMVLIGWKERSTDRRTSGQYRIRRSGAGVAYSQ